MARWWRAAGSATLACSVLVLLSAGESAGLGGRARVARLRAPSSHGATTVLRRALRLRGGRAAGARGGKPTEWDQSSAEGPVQVPCARTKGSFRSLEPRI